MAYKTSRVTGNYASSGVYPSGVDDSPSPRFNASDSMGPIEGVTVSASSVLNDAFDLVELQARLAVADSKTFMQTARLSVLGLVVTFAILIASLPIVAIGLAECIAWSMEWPLWICQLCVGLALVTCGLTIGLWCVKRLKQSLAAFSSTGREATENIRWLRQALSKTFSI